MNVAPKLPFGSGVKPSYEVIPTINQFMNNENVCLEYVLNPDYALENNYYF